MLPYEADSNEVDGLEEMLPCNTGSKLGDFGESDVVLKNGFFGIHMCIEILFITNLLPIPYKIFLE